MSYSVLISEILRQKSHKDLNRLNNTQREYLNDVEIKSLEYINEHISEYKEFPSTDAFVNDGFISVYREDYKGDSLDYLYEKFITSVRERYAKRLLADIELQLASGKGIDEKTVIDRINNLPKALTEKTKNLSDSFGEHLFVGANIDYGFNLGFHELDTAIGYLSRGRVFALIAHPSNGKTTFLTVIATKAFIEGKKVLYCTFEQPEDEIAQNVFACLGKFDTKLYNAKLGTADFTRLQDMKTLAKMRTDYYENKGGKVTIVESQNKTMRKIKAILQKEQDDTGSPYDIVIMDNGVYLMPHETLSGWQRYEDNMQGIKQMAMGDKDAKLEPVAVLVSSQFDNKGTGDTIADIAKTQTIAQSVDVCISITPDTSRLPDGRLLKLLKNRSRGRTYGVAQAVEIDFSQTMIKQSTGLSSYNPIFEISGLGMITIKDDENDEEDS